MKKFILLALLNLSLVLTSCDLEKLRYIDHTDERTTTVYFTKTGDTKTWNDRLSILQRHIIKYIGLRRNHFTDEEAVAAINHAVGIGMSENAVYEAFGQPDGIIPYNEASYCLVYRYKILTCYVHILCNKVESVDQMIGGEKL